MPVWLAAILAIFGALGGGSLVLEYMRRRNLRADKREEGSATVVVKQIDDGANQRNELWQAMERLRSRMDAQEKKLDLLKDYSYRLWDYLMEVKQVYIQMGAMLRAHGDIPPAWPDEPPPLSEVLKEQDDIHRTK